MVLCLRDNSPEWFTQTICSIERKMPYTNAIWGVLLEKNYWIYDLNFPFKQNENEKKMWWKIWYYVHSFRNVWLWFRRQSEVLERKMSEIKMILVYYWGLLHLKRLEYKENSTFFLPSKREKIYPLLCVLIDIKCEGLHCE